MLNIHPSLLPAFPGLEAQRQALDYGARITGATVHAGYVGVDGGLIVLQSAVPVLEDDTVETLSSRDLVEEHRIYPEAIQMLLDGDGLCRAGFVGSAPAVLTALDRQTYFRAFRTATSARDTNSSGGSSRTPVDCIAGLMQPIDTSGIHGFERDSLPRPSASAQTH
jgi:methionyl-tRNA formyltransferase